MADTTRRTTRRTTPVDLLDRLTNRPARSAALTFAFDPNLGARLSEARDQVDLAKRVARQFTSDPNAGPATVVAAQAAVEEAVATYDALVGDADTVTFTIHLRTLKPSRVQELILEHPPTQKQIKTARALAKGNPKGDPHVNETTYLPALLAEAISLVTISDDPKAQITDLTVEQVTALLEPCSQGDRTLLAVTAENLAQASSQVEALGKS